MILFSDLLLIYNLTQVTNFIGIPITKTNPFHSSQRKRKLIQSDKFHGSIVSIHPSIHDERTYVFSPIARIESSAKIGKQIPSNRFRQEKWRIADPWKSVDHESRDLSHDLWNLSRVFYHQERA